VSSSGSQSLQNNVYKRLLPFPKRRTLNACIAAFSSVVLGSFSSLAMGLGLGELDSKSFLGQPLNAHIELVSLEGDIDLNSLIVRQVTLEEAQNMGVESFYAPYRIDFVVDTSTGSPRIRVTSSDPINEPYLSLMVELRWPKGVVYRDYPLLLDPPPVVAARSAPQVRAAPIVTPSIDSTSNTPPIPTRTAPPIEIKLDPLDTEEGKYKVKRGDTLSTIAERWREGTTQGRADTMQWLHQNNSHAFANNNINRLLAGAVLQMPDLSAYKAAEGSATSITPSIAPLPETGSGEGKASEIVANESSQSSNPAGDDAVLTSETRGLLTLGTENRDDKTRELIDMLVRENETLKARMEKIESSEYLDTLKQLIVLQRQQISDLRQKIGVPDTDANQEMDALFAEIGVNRTAAADASSASEPATTAPAPVVASMPDRPEAVLEVDPVIAQPVQTEAGRSWLVWLMFGAGLALSALFIAMFTYYRRMVPAKQRDTQDLDRLPPVLETRESRAEPTISSFKPRVEEKATPARLDYDGEVTPIYVHKKQNENNWMGERADSSPLDTDATVREIQEAFEDMVLDEDALKNLDSIAENSLEGLTEQMPEEVVSDKSLAPSEIKEKSEKKSKKDQASRRPDAEVRMSIAEKMAQYNPDEYRQEMESLGLLELDELNAIEESDEEDVETIVYRAMMFCEFKKYDKARDLLELKMQSIQDARLDAALEQIENLENEARQSSKKAI
jgi:FimV-like protein